jgi:phosphate transport system substrate-binding protein
MNQTSKQDKRSFQEAVDAVSPVVATLLLVLVAAGAAIGFGVFLNGFQKNTQSHVSSETPSQSIHVGGSTTVFDFTQAAKVAWDATHSAKIDLQKGGSGGGLTAVCLGNIDIGESSDDPTTLGAWSTCPDLNHDGTKDLGATPQLTKVAYDTIVLSYNKATFTSATVCNFYPAQIKELYSVNLLGNGRTAATSAATGKMFAVSASGAYLASDLVNTGAPCASGALATGVTDGAIVLTQRSDNSGTEGDFCSQVMADSGCDTTTHQFSDNTLGEEQSGNDGVGKYLGAGALRFGFMDGGGAMNPGKTDFAGKITIAGIYDSAANLITPKTNGKTGSDLAVDSGYKTAVLNCVGKKTAAATTPVVYPICRTLYYVTAGPASSEAQSFIDFVTLTDNNVAFANAGLFVPLY